MTVHDIPGTLEQHDLYAAINRDIAHFQDTGDGRFFWRAYLRCRSAGLPVPDDFMELIDGFASGLVNAQTPQQIGAAMGMAGGVKRHVGHKHSASFVEKWRIAIEVQTVLSMWPNMNKTAALEAVARNNNQSVSVVKKAYYTAKNSQPQKAVKASKPKPAAALAQAISTWR